MLTPLLLAAQLTGDARLEKARTLDDEHRFLPCATREEWDERSESLRRQVLVAAGLWPSQERGALEPVIHGRIGRQGYTVEKVFFAGRPGLYVTGNLYRPSGPGPFAGVLSPHGHWTDGRFCERTDEEVRGELASGAERYETNARYHLQARCAELARLGCVVFHYDMLGFADSTQLEHGAGFGDVEAELWGLSAFGLQTWNSLRALDFLAGLPDVDPRRIGVTGASGGGTQTFVLCAIDERPAAAFPAVMVASRMQGGCACENASHLRVGTDNVELAALSAPRALALSGANDWTIELETRGLPELRGIYRLFGREDLVAGRVWREFPHNFNLPARTMMYEWFARHLRLAEKPIVEHELVPVSTSELSVFDGEHPRPDDALDLAGLRAAWIADAREERELLLSRWCAGDLPGFRRVIGGALRVLLHTELPPSSAIETHEEADLLRLSRAGSGERVPARLVRPEPWDGSLVVLLDEGGGTRVLGQPFASACLARGLAVLGVDVLLTGAARPSEDARLPVDVERHASFPGFTWGYNRGLLAERVHDALTAVAFARALEGVQRVHLVGLGRAGPWALLARALAGDAVDRTLVHWSWNFAEIDSLQDEDFLPGALRCGDLEAFAGLCAPGKLGLIRPAPPPRRTQALYRLAGDGPGRSELELVENAPAGSAAGWLAK